MSDEMTEFQKQNNSGKMIPNFRTEGVIFGERGGENYAKGDISSCVQLNRPRLSDHRSPSAQNGIHSLNAAWAVVFVCRHFLNDSISEGGIHLSLKQFHHNPPPLHALTVSIFLQNKKRSL
ncbi:hypothetical protein CEXT_235171 [Caerostris extrusa]|uniref:Uncharacterized protein n=1 Tax=Caerostris extrusa TaxID=172846 RepID=A0AAV4WC91_CAEEX|nr:hypothetical protein CEXT_235171 [Caerostris extrusa]